MARVREEITEKVTCCRGRFGFGTGYQIARYGDDAVPVCTGACDLWEECRRQSPGDYDENFWAGFDAYLQESRMI